MSRHVICVIYHYFPSISCFNVDDICILPHNCWVNAAHMAEIENVFEFEDTKWAFSSLSRDEMSTSRVRGIQAYPQANSEEDSHLL